MQFGSLLIRFLNCYRAVEAIRQEYVEGESDATAVGRASWIRLREVTGVEEVELRWLGASDPASPWSTGWRITPGSGASAAANTSGA